MSGTFILELPLKIVVFQFRILMIRLEMARILYNAVLKEALRRCALMKESKRWKKALKLPKSPERSALFKEIRRDFSFSDYDLQKFAILVKNQCAIGKHLDTHVCQKIATRVYNACNEYINGKRGKPRFKRKGWMSSIEGKNNKAGIRFRDGYIFWKGLQIPVIFDKKDHNHVQAHALGCRIKYCRLIYKKIKGQHRWFVQLILEGKPIIKEKNLIKEGIVGLDIGPSSLAAYGRCAFLRGFCQQLPPLSKNIRFLQRKMDRSLRAMNPENYNEDGTVKRNQKWFFSKHYKKLKNRVYESYRKLKEYRKRLLSILANEVLELGNKIKTEKLSYRAFQKLYGRSIRDRAPSYFLQILRRKAENAGGYVEEFSTRTTSLSQICHHCGTRQKKSLNQRWHECKCGIERVQRDLYSAYLASHVRKDILDINQAKKSWSGAHPLLEQAISRLKQTAKSKLNLASFGLAQSWSGSLVKGRSKISEAMDVVRPSKV